MGGTDPSLYGAGRPWGSQRRIGRVPETRARLSPLARYVLGFEWRRYWCYASALEAKRFLGYEVVEPRWVAPPITSNRDLLRDVVASRIRSQGPISAGQYLALSPEMQAAVGPPPQLGDPVYQKVLIRDLTNRSLIGRSMDLFVLVQGAMNNAPSPYAEARRLGGTLSGGINWDWATFNSQAPHPVPCSEA